MPPSSHNKPSEIEMLVLKEPRLSKMQVSGLFSQESDGLVPTTLEVGIQLASRVPLPKE